MTDWFARPVLFVSDVDRTLTFYTTMLGFHESWRFAEDGVTHVAQAERGACALIFSSQWPDKAGGGMIFVSLGDDAAVDAVRAEYEARGVTVEEQWWGYRCLVVHDPDGNALWLNYSD